LGFIWDLITGACDFHDLKLFFHFNRQNLGWESTTALILNRLAIPAMQSSRFSRA
jgi:hypothetical protein